VQVAEVQLHKVVVVGDLVFEELLLPVLSHMDFVPPHLVRDYSLSFVVPALLGMLGCWTRGLRRRSDPNALLRGFWFRFVSQRHEIIRMLQKNSTNQSDYW
jgi:hypothetical protein